MPLDHIQPQTSAVRSARSRNRAAAWAYHLAQWRAYQAHRHPDRTEEIDREYDAPRGHRPDFARYHVGSSFAEAPLHKITREDRIQALQTFDAIRAGSIATGGGHGLRPSLELPARLWRAAELRGQAWAGVPEP